MNPIDQTKLTAALAGLRDHAKHLRIDDEEDASEFALAVIKVADEFAPIPSEKQ